jgi:hypothetical protein
MKRQTLMIMIVAFLVLGCEQNTSAPSQSPTNAPTAKTPAAGTRVMLVAGMKTPAFEAKSSQLFSVTPGTRLVPVPGKDGQVTTVTIARDNAGGIDAHCGCPDGCSEGTGEPGSTGCVVGLPTGSPDASCGGNCSTDNSSCSGCFWSFQQPDPSSPSAILAERLDLVANPNP